MTQKATEWKTRNLKCLGINKYDYVGWIKIHPYNIFRANGSFIKSSEGTDYFVATDFNPLKRLDAIFVIPRNEESH